MATTHAWQTNTWPAQSRLYRIYQFHTGCQPAQRTPVPHNGDCPQCELSASKIESLSTQSLHLRLDWLNLVTTGKRAQLVAWLKAITTSDPSGTDRAESDAPSSEAVSEKSTSSEAVSDKLASSEAASDKMTSREDGSDHSTHNHQRTTPPATCWTTGSGMTLPIWSCPANAGRPDMPLSCTLTVGHAHGPRAIRRCRCQKGDGRPRKLQLLPRAFLEFLQWGQLPPLFIQLCQLQLR